MSIPSIFQLLWSQLSNYKSRLVRLIILQKRAVQLITRSCYICFILKSCFSHITF